MHGLAREGRVPDVALHGRGALEARFRDSAREAMEVESGVRHEG